MANTQTNGNFSSEGYARQSACFFMRSSSDVLTGGAFKNHCVRQENLGRDLIQATIKVLDEKVKELEEKISAAEKNWHKANLMLRELEVDLEKRIESLKAIEPYINCRELKGIFFESLKGIYATHDEFLKLKVFLDARQSPENGAEGLSIYLLEDKKRLARWQEYLSKLKNDFAAEGVAGVIEDVAVVERKWEHEAEWHRRIYEVVALVAEQRVNEFGSKFYKDPPPSAFGFGR